MKEEIQVELLKLAIQTINDLEKNHGKMLIDLQYKVRGAQPDKTAPDYDVLLDHVYQHIKALITPSV